jgi:hypothetical protein
MTGKETRSKKGTLEQGFLFHCSLFCGHNENKGDEKT